MGLLDELQGLGVDVEGGIKRLNGKQSLYERMIFKFLDMMKKSVVTPDFDSNDYADVIEVAHAVKGAAGNLSVTPIYEAYGQIVDLLRNQKPEEARKVLEDVLPKQADILACIEKYAEA